MCISILSWQIRQVKVKVCLGSLLCHACCVGLCYSLSSGAFACSPGCGSEAGHTACFCFPYLSFKLSGNEGLWRLGELAARLPPRGVGRAQTESPASSPASPEASGSFCSSLRPRWTPAVIYASFWCLHRFLDGLRNVTHCFGNVCKYISCILPCN